MILKKEIEAMLSEAPQMHGIIFKRALKPHHNDEEILSSFERIIANKPKNFWLMRESRVAGKISVTYRTESGVYHMRFAFTNGEWVPANFQDKFDPMDRRMIGTQCQQLIHCLALRNFNLEQMVLPGKDEQSTSPLYSKYTYVTVGKSRVRYDDPIVSLNTVIDTFKEIIINKKEMQQLNFAPELHHVKAEDLFCEWLYKNRLHDGILDPIYCTLMEKPYIISESGYAFDFKTLFDDNLSLRLEKCPFTRKPITLKPYRVEGYTIAVSHG